MNRNSPEDAAKCIHDLILPLGRKHVGYGSNPSHMEVLGLLMVKSLMKALPKDEIDPEKSAEIHQAFFGFFKLVVYWLQFGFKYEKRYLS